MTDVANAAGVSQTTVSLVLNGAAGARLAADTRARVHAAAQALGYERIRRPAVRQPAPGTRTIAFIANEMAADPWCALALEGARDKAWEHGTTILAAATGGEPDIEQAVLERFSAEPLLGVIYATVHTTRIEPKPALAALPAVLINCYAADRSLPSIVPGEVAGGHVATDRLIRDGHRRIGMINGEAWMDAARDRLKGYRQALATADLPFDADLVRAGTWQPRAGYERTIELMRLASPPTAIFCANDLMALGCMEALKELGLDIPGDVSVIGYDDREIAQHTQPPLTTVLLPHNEIGARAVEYLIDHQAGPPARHALQLKVECPLVERRSVGPAASGERLPAERAQRGRAVTN